jgi:hypothetical protein
MSNKSQKRLVKKPPSGKSLDTNHVMSSQSYSKQNEKTTLSFISISVALRKCELEIAPKDKGNQVLNAIHYRRLHRTARQMLKAVIPNESLDK